MSVDAYRTERATEEVLRISRQRTEGGSALNVLAVVPGAVALTVVGFDHV